MRQIIVAIGFLIMSHSAFSQATSTESAIIFTGNTLKKTATTKQPKSSTKAKSNIAAAQKPYQQKNKGNSLRKLVITANENKDVEIQLSSDGSYKAKSRFHAILEKRLLVDANEMN